MKVFKVPGKVRKWIAIFYQAFFYENIQSSWKSAHCQGIVKETMDAHWRQCKNVAIWAEMSQFTRFFVILLKCWDLRALSHFGWNVAIYAFSQEKIVCCQAPKTILHPCLLGPYFMKSWVPIGSLFLSMEVPISLGNSV